MFKVKTNDARTTSMTLHQFSSVSIIDFKHLFISWDAGLTVAFIICFYDIASCLFVITQSKINLGQNAEDDIILLNK